jgi:hypothetical protein
MTPAQELEQALAATAAALEAGDPEAAALASGQAAAASAALVAAGTSLAADALARVRALQARCEAASTAVQKKLAGELDVASRSRRAADAYNR